MAACVAFYAERFLRRHGLSTEGLVVACDYVWARDPARVGEIDVRVEAPGLTPDRFEAFTRVIERCPIHNTFRQPTPVVVDQTVLPFEEVGDGLRLDANLDPAQAGQKQVHFPHEARSTALAVARGFHYQAHASALAFEQPPFCRELVGADQSRGREVKALTAHAQAGVFAKRLFPIGEEIGPGDLALDQDRAALPFPTNYVRRFSTGTGLFREHDAAAIFPPQPLLGKTDKLLVGHDLFCTPNFACWKVPSMLPP